MKTTLNIQHMRKSFGDQTVLKDINLSLEAGKIYGIEGYNGSGKSVRYKCIRGLMLPDEGAGFLNGRERKAGEMLSDTGFIIEKPACLKREFNVYDKPFTEQDCGDHYGNCSNRASDICRKSGKYE